MIEKIFEDVERNLDFIGGFIEVIRIKGKEIRASIDVYKWKIILEIGDEIKWKDEFIKDILLHEIMHWKICPMDIFYHYELFDLSFKNFKNSEDSGYILNAFEDLIVNTYNKFKNPPYEGQLEFFKLQTSHSFSPFYSFFVILNLYLWNEEKRIKEIFKDFQNNKEKYEEIIEDVKKLFKKWNIPENKEERIGYLKNHANWKFLFNEFIIFSKKYFRGERIPLSVLSFFEEEMSSNESIEKYIKLKAKRREKPSFISSSSFYDIYYTIISPYVEIETDERSGFEIPFISYGKENFDIKNHSFYEINFKRPFFDKDSPFKNNINFYVEPFKKGIFIKKGVKDFFPDLMFLVDSSHSMTYGSDSFLPWGKKYHNLLIGIYGIFNFLKIKRIAPYIKYSLINFSSKTISTGWLSYNEIDKIKKLLFSPQRGNTYIDIKKIEENLKNNIFIIFITDGEIHNWNKIRKRFMEIVKNYKFVLFQIEKESSVYEDLKDKIPCFLIEDSEDIPKKIIEYTKGVYA
ncbi:MAG: hypothetical protein ABIM83_07900 [candidate division WOR-3 bacterium]